MKLARNKISNFDKKAPGSFLIVIFTFNLFPLFVKRNQSQK